MPANSTAIRGLGASIALFGAMVGPAFAQEGGGVSEIIVTAQKRAQNLQDVPAAVSVLSSQTLDASAGFNIEALQTVVPTLTFNKGGTTLNSSLFLRGVGTINFSIAAEPSVAFVLDGVVLARAGEAFGDLYDLERIEVLRGPQGTLFGKNASAGVLNVISRAPGEELAGQIEVSAYEGDEFKAKASVDLPFSETVRTRVTGFTGFYDGNITNLNRASLNDGSEKVNGYQRWGVRAITDWDATEQLSFKFIGDYRRADDDCCVEVVGTSPTGATAAAILRQLEGVRFEGDETRTVNIDLVTRTEEIAWGASGQADYELASGHTLTAITAYRSWDNNEIREGDWRSLPAAYPGNAFVQLHDIGPQESTTFSQELRLASPDDQRLEYVVGLYYSDADSERTFRRDVLRCNTTTLPADATGQTPCLPGASTFVQDFSEATFGSEFINYAVFGQGTLKLTEALSLLAGLRYTKDELSYFHDRIPATVALPGIRTDGSGFRGSTEEENLSGKVGATLRLTDDINTYATYTRGYKGPAFNVFFNMNPSGLNVIEAETADAYEVGTKTTWLNGRLVLNAAGFYAEYDNFQANSPDILNGVVITRLTNAGVVSTKGVELDWLIQPVDPLTITGGLAYTDAQIEEFKDPVTGQLSSAREGEPIAFAPEWKGAIGVNYAWEPGTLPFDVDFSSGLSYVSEQRTTIPAAVPDPRTFIDGYTLLDASIAFSDKEDRLRFAIIGKNLTDESFASQIATGGPGGAILYRIPREADRYFGVSLRAKIGG